MLYGNKSIVSLWQWRLESQPSEMTGVCIKHPYRVAQLNQYPFRMGTTHSSHSLESQKDPFPSISHLPVRNSRVAPHPRLTSKDRAKSFPCSRTDRFHRILKLNLCFFSLFSSDESISQLLNTGPRYCFWDKYDKYIFFQDGNWNGWCHIDTRMTGFFYRLC